MTSLYTEPIVRAPVRRDRAFEREQAERFGLLCRGDIRRCLQAEYLHHSVEVRTKLLDRDLRCAVALARIAWRYALRVEDGR